MASILLNETDVTPDEWDALAARGRNVFGTREWLETWLDHEPLVDRPVTVVVRHRDGRLAALLPLGLHRRRPRVFRPLGPWPPPEGPLICAPEDAPWALREVARQLRARDDWDLIEFDAVPCDQRWRDALRAVTISRRSDHSVDLQGHAWDELLAASSRNFRSQLNKRQRRLERKYEVRFRRTHDASILDADLELFLELHWLRWGEEVNVLTPSRRALLRDFAAQALQRGWLALWFLELDGQAVAANLDLRFAGTEVFFMAGNDPAFADDRVGFVLTFHAVREAAHAGMREFRFLRGDEQHKTRLPNVNRPVEHIAISRTACGDLTLGASGVERRLRAGASAMLAPRLKRHIRRLLP